MKKIAQTSNFLSSFDLAGFTYYDGVEVFSELKIGTELSLVAEPENPYDYRAVAVYFKEQKIGFLPRNENRIISKFINLGYTDLFRVFVNRISAFDTTEHQIGVVVKINCIN